MLLSRTAGILLLVLLCSLMVPLSETAGQLKCYLDGVTPEDACVVDEADTLYLDAKPESGSVRSLIFTLGGPYAKAEPQTTNPAEPGPDYIPIVTEINGNWDDIPLEVEDDCEVEPTEILFAFIRPEGESGPDDYVEITIEDDDDSYYLENEHYDVNEDDGVLTFYVCRDKKGAFAESEIDYSTCDITAVSGESGDFTAKTGTIDFSSSSTCESAKIIINEDNVDESEEVFGINIKYDDPAVVGCTGKVGEPSKAFVTIHNVDAEPEPEPEPEPEVETTFSFEFCDYAITEPVSGTSMFMINLIRVGDTSSEETVDVDTRGVGASSDADFVSLQSKKVTFGADSSTEAFGITIIADKTVEDPETLEVSLSGPSDGSVGDPSKATVTIYDISTTSCCISFESSIYTVKESGTAKICLRREGNPEKSGTIGVITKDIDATSDADYTAISTSVPFATGVTDMCFDVDTQEDWLKEDTECLKVALVESTTSNAIPACSGESAQVMIKDDDDEFYFEGITYKVKESAKQVVIIIVRSGYLGQESSICVSTQSGDDPSCDAQAMFDYGSISNEQIDFDVNQKSHQLLITINEDNVAEDEEELIVVLETCSSNSDVYADQIGFPRKATVYIRNTFTCTTSCGNNGQCVAENTCGCFDGYTGPVCDIPVCDPTCANGACVDVNSCQCSTGWTGDDCSTPVCTPTCIEGECVDVNMCQCVGGWSGNNCNTRVTTIAMSVTVIEFDGNLLVFTDDLNNPTSERYMELKATVEERNNALYSQMIPGFVAYIVTGFAEGSVIINHEIVIETAADVTAAEVTQTVTEAIDNNDVLGDTGLKLSPADPLIEAQPDAKCPENYCQNRGDCIETETSYYCFCQTGFTGPQCLSVIQQPPVDDDDVDEPVAGGLSDGAIAAIILGTFAGVLLLVALGMCWWWIYFGRQIRQAPKLGLQQQAPFPMNLRPYNGPNPAYDINNGVMGTPPLY